MSFTIAVRVSPRPAGAGRCLLVALAAAAALAAPAASAAPVAISGATPFGGLPCSNFPGQVAGAGTLFLDSEVEPFIGANPANPLNLIAVWQQDRWSNGGARGNAAGVSMNGGATWTTVLLPGLTQCTGGPWERASDPWVTFSPNGTAYFMSLVFQTDPAPDRPGGFGPNAMVVHRSTNGGQAWTGPITLAEDVNPRLLHDKNSMTADPNDSRFVYAVWDRLSVPNGTVINPENVIGLGFKGPVTFTRTANAGQSWEPIRFLYDPGGNNQTIGNQIAVLPASRGGTVINLFNEILNFKNNDGGTQFDFNLSFIFSNDHGGTWLPHGKPRRVQKLQSLALFRAFGTLTPDTNQGVRTGDILFDVAVDPANGNLYAVWQDARFSGFSRDEIAFSMSVNGGTTWTAPIKVNQTPVGLDNARRQAFTPSVEVVDGAVAVTYYDFRNDPVASPAQELTDYFAVSCAANCASAASWIGSEIKLTAASFDILDAPLARGFFTGDYEGLTTDGTDGLAAFSQPVGSDPGDILFNRF
jgi:hypothetical protein